MPDTVIFDVDGTLVDSNYQHTLAWYRALRRSSITVPIWRIHRTIGMGGDKLITELAGPDAEKTHGDEVRTSWEKELESLIGEIQPLPGAHELLVEVKRRGFRIVLASSGKAAHVEHSMELIGGRELADAWTTSDDVSESKPAPDLVNTALQKVSRSAGIMIGDSTWDVIAAEKVNVPTIALLTGGSSRDELNEAASIAVFDSPQDLLDHLDITPLAHPSAETRRKETH
ncbi:MULTISPECIES: HAD family hydrolase [Microbacterium]|uniref:HAD family hydrolase n=1 Tax=Microbacterium TaxID=33882 RepID=UPI0022E69955|nr:HAD family hydrolase [Microbacterium liquefaciens]